MLTALLEQSVNTVEVSLRGQPAACKVVLSGPMTGF